MMNKKYKAILFDMDGTLLPMDPKYFERGYFKFLCQKLAPYGIEPEKLISAVWSGTAAMVKNDGSQINIKLFWKNFHEVTGIDPENGIRLAAEEFYRVDFKNAKQFTMDNPLAKEAIKAARDAAPIVCLATNPIFPMDAQKVRLEWLGLSVEDFDLVTSCDADTFCKPNPAYYLSVCEQIGVKPEECLLIGNDEGEDMYAGTMAGIKDCFLVTDTMIANEKHPWNGAKGTFVEMLEMLKSLSEEDRT